MLNETMGNALTARSRPQENNFLAVRLLAASLVVFGHSFSLTTASCSYCVDPVRLLGFRYAGDLGLLMLFVISGFLVADSYARRRDLWGFFISRALRLVPALLAFNLLLALVAGPVLTSLSLPAYFSDLQLTAFLLHDSTFSMDLIWSLPGVLGGAPLNGTIWTLPLEVRLYTLLALAGVFGVLGRWPIGIAVLVGLTIWGVFSPATFPLLGNGPGALQVASYFAAGVAIYVLRNYLPATIEVYVAAIVVALLARGRPEFELLFSAAAAYLTVGFAVGRRIALPRWVSDYSYGIYLYGFPIQQLLVAAMPNLDPYAMFILALPASWLMGAISWHALEKHALRAKRRRPPAAANPAQSAV